MVTSVQLGNFFSSGGRTVLGSAGGSGLDTEGLINALVDARSIPVKRIEDKVTLNTHKSDALKEFQTLLGKLKDASDLLRNVPGVGKAAGNAFDYVSASVTSNTSVSGATYLSVTAEPGTVTQSYTIDEITQLAKAKKQTTNSFSVADADAQVVYTTAGANQFGAGTIAVNGTNITLEDGDSLARVAAKFNAVSDDTGISASVVKLGTNNYKLFFTATETGEDANFDLGDPGDPTADSITSDPSGVFANITIGTTQQARNAEFILDGETIERQSNDVSDVIDGITFSLLAETPALTELTVDVDHDQAVAKNAIISFINAYNDVKVFAGKQTKLAADGTFADDAYLATDGTLRNGVASIGNELSKIVDGIAATQLRRLSDLGISFTDLPESEDNPYVRNVLTLDEDVLNSKLSSAFDEVRRVFEFTFDSNNTNLVVFKRTNALAVTDFTLTINPGSSIYQADYTDASGSHTIDLDATVLSSGTGYKLVGQEGTVLEGMEFIYASTTSATVNVSLSQGIGDRLYNLTDSLLEADSGAVDATIDSLRTANESLQEDMDRLNAQIEVYRQQLLDKFSLLESAVARVNTLLSALDAQDQTRYSS